MFIIIIMANKNKNYFNFSREPTVSGTYGLSVREP